MKVAVLPVFCNDSPRVTAHTRAHVEAHFEAAKRYYETQSGGREHLVYKVFDWFKLPMASATWDALGFKAGDQAVPMFKAGTKADLAGFDHFVLVIDKVNARAAAWRANDPTFKYMHMSAADMTPALLSHELGHLAGAGHGHLRAPSGDIEYGDSFCVMGGEDEKYTFADDLGASGPGMAASMLGACGWLDFNRASVAANLDLGAGRNSALVELAPLSGAPGPNAGGRPVVAWSDGLVHDQRLTLEFRLRGGWDRGLPESGSSPGWIVARLTDGRGAGKSPALIGSIGASAGATLELPDASVTVSVTSVTANRVALKVVHRLRQVFSGDAGVIYTLDDTGNLSWYRHDGRADGSFRWADNAARKVGAGWNFKHVFSGGNGVVYAIDRANDLLWFRHDGRGDGTFRWAGDARKVGTGWNFKHVFSGGNGVIYAINEANELLWFRHDGRGDGTFRWADTKGRRVGTGWSFRRVFSGGNGVIYAVNDDDDLLWFRHDGRADGTFKWADVKGRKVGSGWTFKHVFGGSDGVVYAIDDVNDLLWFRHDGRADGTFRWADSKGRKVGSGWSFKPPSDVGDAVIYAVGAGGELDWYRHDGRDDGSFRWRLAKPRVVGQGWSVRQLFSADDGVIYSCDDAGALRWYRHDGQVNGSFNWTLMPERPDGSDPKVGIGWKFKHLFSGSDGVIYAIDDANDLLWFRHDGRTDGTFRWTDTKGRKVGSGWDFKHVFSGADGVIYAINSANDLLWFRHDGRTDGTFRWTDPKPRKVGSGWSFKRVFSGADGVIYAINDANELLWFRHDGRANGSFRWTDPKPRKVGTGWQFQRVFAG